MRQKVLCDIVHYILQFKNMVKNIFILKLLKKLLSHKRENSIGLRIMILIGMVIMQLLVEKVGFNMIMTRFITYFLREKVFKKFVRLLVVKSQYAITY